MHLQALIKVQQRTTNCEEVYKWFPVYGADSGRYADALIRAFDFGIVIQIRLIEYPLCRTHY